MKALTVLQPWASLLVRGAKVHETRSWQTAHRGPILIHAGRRFPDSARDLAALEPFFSALGRTRPNDLPRGAILGVATIADCIPTEALADLAPAERAFGDYNPGRWAWHITDPTPLAVPIACNGKLGLFDVDDAFLRQFADREPALAAALQRTTQGAA